MGFRHMYYFRDVLRFLTACLSLLPALAWAEVTTIPIPDQGWAITFESPPLRTVREADSNDHYMYSGNANNFAVSLYVDTPACQGGTTHEDVLNCFWPAAGKDPLIQHASVKKSCSAHYCSIRYDLENTFQEAAIKQKHLVFLFATRDRWARLHVTLSNPSAEDINRLETLAATLRYQ